MAMIFNNSNGYVGRSTAYNYNGAVAPPKITQYYMEEPILDQETVACLWRRMSMLEDQNMYLKRVKEDLSKCLTEYQEPLRVDYKRMLELMENFIERNFVPRKDWTQQQERQFSSLLMGFPPLTKAT